MIARMVQAGCLVLSARLLALASVNPLEPSLRNLLRKLPYGWQMTWHSAYK